MNFKTMFLPVCLAAVMPWMVGEASAQRDIKPVDVGLFSTADFSTAQDVTDQSIEGITYYLWVKVQWSNLKRPRFWHVAVLVDGLLLHEFNYDNLDSDNIVHPSASQRTLWSAPLTIDGGSHTFTLITDNREEVRETYERNNAYSRTFTVTPYPSGYQVEPRDFNGDGATDLHVYDPSTSTWYTSPSSNGVDVAQFGYEPTVQFAADFDGDGKSDKGIYDRNSGTWYVQQTLNGLLILQMGNAFGVPVPADYDGDGKAEAAIYDMGSRTWMFLQPNGQTNTLDMGVPQGIPVPADYDGDGKADAAVFDPNTAIWHIQRSMFGFWSATYGELGDRPVPYDYDGDGICDLAVWHPASGVWEILAWQQLYYVFGFAGVIPVPGDYDGDGLAEIAVYDPPSGTWYMQTIIDPVMWTKQFGWSGALPVGSRK